MSEAPYVNFYTSDFLAGTSGMTAATKGVYITLLSLVYETEAPLRQSWDTLARRCGCTLPAFRRAVQSLVDDGKITVSDDGIWSVKCEKHIAHRRERQMSARSAAEKRWQKTKGKQGGGDAPASAAQCQPEPEPEREEREEERPYGLLSSGDDERPPARPSPLDEVAEAVAAFNNEAEAAGWPTVRVLSASRRAAIKARLRDCGGLVGWRDALARARASPHLCGQNDRGWTASFDFLTRQSSFAKLMEGNYDRSPRARNQPTGRPANGSDPALEQIARLAGLGQA
jgi:uncharacterized protein YdaU (DUF1376 family)